MNERKWLPSEWLDEVVPMQGQSPNDFLKRNEEGVLQLVPLDDPEDTAWTPSDLQPGQVVEFSWFEDRGYATLVVREDGTWYCDPPFEGDANCISDFDGDIIAQSVEDYVEQRTKPEFEPNPADRLVAGQYELDGWYWSDSIPFRVRVLESGAASFEQVEVLA